MKKEKTNIVEHMRAELNKCRGNWSLLIQMSGDVFSYRWLVGFANGTIKEPSFTKIYLLGKYIGMKIVVQPGKHFLDFKPE